MVPYAFVKMSLVLDFLRFPGIMVRYLGHGG